MTSLKQYTLEKKKGAFKNWTSIDTGNICHRTQNEGKQNNTAQKIKNMSNTDPLQNQGVISGVREVTVSYKTPTMLLTKLCKAMSL